MDPLSVSAAVAGLLTITAKVAQVLNDVIRRSRHAPEACRRVRDAVGDLRGILGQLQRSMLGTRALSAERTSLIMVDQVVATLSACVTMFSDLDVFAEGLQSDENMGLLDRLRWVAKERDLRAVLEQLEVRKSSLTLMLSILTCQKQTDAEAKVDVLCGLVQQILAQNVALARRMAASDERHAIDDNTIRPQRPAAPSVADSEEPEQVNRAESDLTERSDQDATAPTPDQIGLAFEELLLSSRAYQSRAQRLLDTFSVTRVTEMSATWSALSSISLSELSHIDVLAIPVYASDLANREAYDFEPSRPQSTVASTQSSKGKGRPVHFSWLRVKDQGRESVVPPEPPILKDETAEQGYPRVFGVPLEESFSYARDVIHFPEHGPDRHSYRVYLPVIIAETCLVLREKGSVSENIFAQSGDPASIAQLQQAFDAPPYYGRRGTSQWVESVTSCHTVFDCASILLYFLESLPEPLIPYLYYDLFTAYSHNMRDRAHDGTLSRYRPESVELIVPTLKLFCFQESLRHLPALREVVLAHVLFTLQQIASNSGVNHMTAERLARLFQPSLLSRPFAQMDEEEVGIAVDLLAFMIKHPEAVRPRSWFPKRADMLGSLGPHA